MAAHADVFVSYKAEDRARVQPIVAALEAEGFIVWWDTRIEGGANWRRSIEEQLNAAKCVVVAWTKRSVGPEGEFVRDEAALAKRRGIYLPILLDPIEPPLGFREIQAISLRGWRKGVSDPCFRVLADAIRQCLTNGHVAGRSTSHERARISRRAVVTGGVGIGVLAASGAGVWLLSRPARANAKRILLFFRSPTYLAIRRRHISPTAWRRNCDRRWGGSACRSLAELLPTRSGTWMRKPQPRNSTLPTF